METRSFHPRSASLSVDRRRFSKGVLGLAAASGLLAGRAAATEIVPQGVDDGLTPRYPLSHGGADLVAALMAYEAERDPDAAYFRSRTLRAARIMPFSATQAHPDLDPRPQVASLWNAYGPLDPKAGDGFSKMRYGRSPPGGVQVSRMLAYQDVVVGWAGTGIVPNAAMVDLAHRNGALCLGTIFQPDRRFYDSSAVPAPKVAAKLVALAQYFGFDGYFFNFEDGDARSHAQVLDLILMMRRSAATSGVKDFQVQFYDGSADMAQLLPARTPHHPQGDGSSFPTSVMLDQGWSGYDLFHGCCSGQPVQPHDVYDYCRAHGFDPFKSAYFGFQLYPGPGYFSAIAPTVITPNQGGAAFGSLQLYSADDGLRTLLRVDDARDGRGDRSNPPQPARVERRKLYALERRLFSGASENPAMDNAPSEQDRLLYAPTQHGRHIYSDYEGGLPKPTDQVNLPISYGVANFITERSPIAATPFVTRFNTGEGDRFFVDGEPVSDTAWFNMGIQDILPTWQWRTEPLDGRFDRSKPSPPPLVVDYDFETAFDGGSSLRISGLLSPETGARLWLYKTALRLGPGASGQVLSLVVKGLPTSGARVQVGLVFQDAPTAPVWVDVKADAALANGWRRASIALAPYGGRTLAAILLGCGLAPGRQAPAEVALNIGELYIGDPHTDAGTPPPTGFAVEAFRPRPDGRAAELRLKWDYANGVAYYDLYCRPFGPSGARLWLGRIDGDRYYCADAPWSTERDLTLEIVAAAKAAPLAPGGAARIVLSQN